MQRAIGDLDEVLDNLGVFRCFPDDLIATCPSGFRRVPIAQGSEFYLSLQGFGPDQHAFAHTHPDSEEWVMVLRGSGQALFGEVPIELSAGVVVGRGAKHPHGFISGPCAFGGKCRRCPRCGGHSTRMQRGSFVCENCNHQF